MKIKVYFMQRKVHALLCGEKFISCGKKVHALLCREKFILCKKKSSRTFMWRKRLFHVEKISRTFMWRKSLFHVDKSSRTFMVGSWYLSNSFLMLRFWSVVLHPKVLIPSIGFMVLCYYSFGPWYCERPKTIKGEGDHLEKHHLNY